MVESRYITRLTRSPSPEPTEDEMGHSQHHILRIGGSVGVAIPMNRVPMYYNTEVTPGLSYQIAFEFALSNHNDYLRLAYEQNQETHHFKADNDWMFESGSFPKTSRILHLGFNIGLVRGDGNLIPYVHLGLAGILPETQSSNLGLLVIAGAGLDFYAAETVVLNPTGLSM